MSRIFLGFATKTRLCELQMQKASVLLHQFTWDSSCFDSKRDTVTKSTDLAYIVLTTEVVMCSEVQIPTVEDHVPACVELVHNVKQAAAFCQGPVMQVCIGMKEPFGKVQGMLVFTRCQEGPHTVIVQRQLVECLEATQHRVMYGEMGLPQCLSPDNLKTRQKVLCLCSLGLEAWLLLVRSLDVPHHGRPQVGQPGAHLKLSVKFLHSGKNGCNL